MAGGVALAGASLIRPREARAAKGLTVVLESEVTILDPHATTAAITRTFGLHVFDSLGENSKMLTKEEGDFYINGADVMDISPAFFDGVFIPETSRASDGSGTN